MHVQKANNDTIKDLLLNGFTIISSHENVITLEKDDEVAKFYVDQEVLTVSKREPQLTPEVSIFIMTKLLDSKNIRPSRKHLKAVPVLLDYLSLLHSSKPFFNGDCEYLRIGDVITTKEVNHVIGNTFSTTGENPDSVRLLLQNARVSLREPKLSFNEFALFSEAADMLEDLDNHMERIIDLNGVVFNRSEMKSK